MEEKTIICGGCGKPIMKRRSNGIWHFMFGRNVSGDRPAIDMLIKGSIIIRCWRSHCGTLNKLSFFPNEGGE